MKKLLLATGISLIGTAIAVPAPVPTETATNALTGTLRLFNGARKIVSNGQPPENGEPCEGDRGYSDISGGTQIVVRDATNNIVAISKLQPGRYWFHGNDRMNIGGKVETFPVWSCDFAIAVPNIPRSPFYSIAIGRREAIAFTIEDLDTKGWKLELSLGR